MHAARVGTGWPRRPTPREGRDACFRGPTGATLGYRHPSDGLRELTHRTLLMEALTASPSRQRTLLSSGRLAWGSIQDAMSSK